MRWKLEIAAAIAGALALAGCHGPPIVEALPDGGGTTGAAGNTGAGGTGGTAGRGGTTGTAGTGAGGRGGTTGTAGAGGRGGAGGAAGAGCAAQMTPEFYYRGMYGPVWTDGTSHRFYWAEQTTPTLSVQYMPGDQPMHFVHKIAVDTSLASHGFTFAVSESLLAATWATDWKIAVWGPDNDSLQMGVTRSLSNPSAVAADGTTVLFSWDPMGGNPAPGIYQWDGTTTPPVFATYQSLGGNWTLGNTLRLTPSKLLLSDVRNVYMVDRATKAKVTLFQNPGNDNVVDLRPARPHTLDAGVVVCLDDANYWPTGHDYYVDISTAGTAPVDLPAKVDALADASACKAAAHYAEAGVLFQRRYIYEGDGGVFAVDVSASGVVSNLVRLTDMPYRYLEVTGDGDLFGGQVYNVSRWDYYRLGRF